MQRIILLFSLLISMGIISCTSNRNKNGQEIKVKDNGDTIVMTYSKAGILESEIGVKKGMYHGEAIYYYKDGKIMCKEHYNNGLKEGICEIFFENGKLNSRTNYSRNKIDGIKKTYYENGALLAEYVYKNGHLEESKEFKKDGSPKKNIVRIVFDKRDELAMNNTYTVYVKLSEPQKNTKFFIVDKGKNGEDLTPMEQKNGVGILRYYCSPGDDHMESIYIAAMFFTRKGTKMKIYNTLDLAISN